jgi:hypothetical protein
MLNWIATVLLNRLVFLAAIMLALNAFVRTGCHPADNAFGQLGQAIASFKEIAQALQ